MTQEINPTQQALAILAKAAENYANGLDELARAFTIPQLQQAIAVIDAALKPATKESENAG